MIDHAEEMLEELRTLWPGREWMLHPELEAIWKDDHPANQHRELRTTTLSPVEVVFVVFADCIEGWLWVYDQAERNQHGDSPICLHHHVYRESSFADSVGAVRDVLVRWCTSLLSSSAPPITPSSAAPALLASEAVFVPLQDLVADCQDTVAAMEAA